MNEKHLPEERSTAELITEYAGLLWHRAWLLVLLAALAGGAAYYFSIRQTPIYKASAMAMINVAPNAQDFTALYYGAQLGESYAKLMTTRAVLDTVAEKLGVESLPVAVEVTPIINTQLLTVDATGPDPEQAALVVNTLVDVFSEQIQADQAVRYADSKQNLKVQMDTLAEQIQTITGDLAVLGQQIQSNNTTLNALMAPDNQQRTQEEIDARNSMIQQVQDALQTSLVQQAERQTILQNYRTSFSLLLQSYEQIRLTESQSSMGIILKDPALVPLKPFSPQPLNSAFLAALVGLFLGAGIVFLIDFLDDTLRDPQEITQRWGIPILGLIGNFNAKEGSHLITEKEPRSPVSEAFRSIRTNLQFASISSPLQTLLITSPSPEEGKTTVAGNLACVFSQVGRKTVVVDADLRKPRLHKLFKLQNRYGLTDLFLHGEESLAEAIQNVDVENLSILSSGSLPPNPSELISSNRMMEIINTLKGQFDVVLLDAPPSMVVTDANVLANHADGVILVVRPGKTKKAAIKNTIIQMEQVKANVVGVVINGLKASRSRYSYYQGYYGKQYGKG